MPSQEPSRRRARRVRAPLATLVLALAGVAGVPTADAQSAQFAVPLGHTVVVPLADGTVGNVTLTGLMVVNTGCASASTPPENPCTVDVVLTDVSGTSASGLRYVASGQAEASLAGASADPYHFCFLLRPTAASVDPLREDEPDAWRGGADLPLNVELLVDAGSATVLSVSVPASAAY